MNMSADGSVEYVKRNGYMRWSYDYGTCWMPLEVVDNPLVRTWHYGVIRYPFVPGYNLIRFSDDDDTDNDDYVMSNHKTLAEAMALLKMLLANGNGLVYHKTS